MYEIGYIYTYGKGVEKNVSEAVEYTLMAAELGDVDGQFSNKNEQCDQTPARYAIPNIK